MSPHQNSPRAPLLSLRKSQRKLTLSIILFNTANTGAKVFKHKIRKDSMLCSVPISLKLLSRGLWPFSFFFSLFNSYCIRNSVKSFIFTVKIFQKLCSSSYQHCSIRYFSTLFLGTWAFVCIAIWESFEKFLTRDPCYLWLVWLMQFIFSFFNSFGCQLYYCIIQWACQICHTHTLLEREREKEYLGQWKVLTLVDPLCIIVNLDHFELPSSKLWGFLNLSSFSKCTLLLPLTVLCFTVHKCHVVLIIYACFMHSEIY